MTLSLHNTKIIHFPPSYDTIFEGRVGEENNINGALKLHEANKS